MSDSATPWTHVHWVRDAVSPSHPLPPPSPFAFNFSQHQGLLFLNIHNIKFPILTILGVQLSGIEPVHIVVQLLSPSISRTFSTSQSETQHPLNKNCSFTLPFTTPGHHCSFCFYEFDNFRHLIWVESYCICPFVTSWFHLACYPQGSSSCFMVVTRVWISFPGHFFSSSSPSLVHSFNFCHPLLKIETWRHNNVQDSDYIKTHTHTHQSFSPDYKRILSYATFGGGSKFWSLHHHPLPFWGGVCFPQKMVLSNFAPHWVRQGWSNRQPLNNVYSNRHYCVAINLRSPCHLSCSESKVENTLLLFSTGL